jgi:LmeA-like phospholipid-binding
VRKLIVVLLVLAGLFIAADFGARALAESWVSRELATSLDLSQRPGVSLGGFPFIPHLVTGDVPSISADAKDFSSNGLAFADVSLTLHRVTFSPTQLARGQKTKISFHDGTGTASLTGEDVTKALQAAGAPSGITVKLDGDHAVIGSDQIGLGIAVSISLDGGHTLVLQPRGSSIGSFHLSLPTIVPGLSYRAVEIKDSLAVLSLGLTHASIAT